MAGGRRAPGGARPRRRRRARGDRGRLYRRRPLLRARARLSLERVRVRDLREQLSRPGLPARGPGPRRALPVPHRGCPLRLPLRLVRRVGLPDPDRPLRGHRVRRHHRRVPRRGRQGHAPGATRVSPPGALLKPAGRSLGAAPPTSPTSTSSTGGGLRTGLCARPCVAACWSRDGSASAQTGAGSSATSSGTCAAGATSANRSGLARSNPAARPAAASPAQRPRGRPGPRSARPPWRAPRRSRGARPAPPG